MTFGTKDIIGIYAINDVSDSTFPYLIHDHNIALFSQENLKALQLERVSRVKYDARLPVYIDLLIKDKIIRHTKDIILIHVDHEIGTSFISKSGKFRAENGCSITPDARLSPSKAMWNGVNTESYHISHELAHVFSNMPFYGLFKENSLLVHYDGGASKSNFSCWLYKNGQLSLIDYHYKLKKYTGLLNANALTFGLVGGKLNDQNGVPGKFMGLASYGTYDDKIEQWLVKNNYFANIWSSKKEFFDELERFFGVKIEHFNSHEKVLQDVAATIHEVFIRESMKEFKQLTERYQPDYLYYSGGVALNIKMNKRLYDSNWYKEIYIPPCTNDTGLALGAVAGYCYFNTVEIPQSGPYLNSLGIKGNGTFDYNFDDIKETATKIAENKIIGICNGFGEIGPRALGNRSIIARADSKKLAQKVSMECKKREWYRPIAPVILAKNFSYFTGEDKIPAAAKFMLYDFKIRKSSCADMAGCVHVDGTARIQVINNRDENAYLYDLLTYLEEEFGIKAITNTSFNSRGEPIVHSPSDAVKNAAKMKLDYLVLNGKLRTPDSM